MYFSLISVIFLPISLSLSLSLSLASRSLFTPSYTHISLLLPSFSLSPSITSSSPHSFSPLSSSPFYPVLSSLPSPPLYPLLVPHRKSSCPQCRDKATQKKLIRLYFDTRNPDGDVDPDALTHQIDNLKV